MARDKDVEFTITVRESGLFKGELDIEIDGPEGHGNLAMPPHEWEAFQSLLQPSTKADFTIIEGE